MNVLSSILNWIGNTIGANPNTLTTTDKTLVGAITELNANKEDFVNQWANANSTTTINFKNLSAVQQHLIILAGNARTASGMYIISLSAAGAVNQYTVLEATNVTFSASSYKLAITTGTSGARVAVFPLQRNTLPTITI